MHDVFCFLKFEKLLEPVYKILSHSEIQTTFFIMIRKIWILNPPLKIKFPLASAFDKLFNYENNHTSLHNLMWL